MHGYRYVKATCVRETTQGSTYSLWVLIDGTGTIVSGSCTCTADDSCCKHMAALLFSLASFTERHRDRHTQVGTDEPCQWDKPRKESTPMEADDIDVRVKQKDTPLLEPSMKFYTSMQLAEDKFKDTEKKLKALSQPGTLAYMYLSDSDDDMDCEMSIPSVHDCVTSSNQTDFLHYLKGAYTEDVVEEIELLTRGQSECVERSKYRAGHLTSTVVHNVLHVKCPSPHCYIVNSILGLGFRGNVHTAYGHQMEVVARTLFTDIYSKSHSKFKCTTSGLVIRPDMPHLAASPDGIITCSCCKPALVEIKCPSALRDKDIQTLCESKEHKRNISYSDGLKIVDNGPWDTQIQFTMGITQIEKCYLVVYTGKSPYINVAEVHFRQDQWAETVEVATDFYKKYVIPRLFEAK